MMRRRVLRNGKIWCAAALVSVTALSPKPSYAEPKDVVKSRELDERTERARSYMKRGIEAFDSDKLDEARAALTESFSLRESYDAAGLLGQIEFSEKRYVEAAKWLSFSLEHFPTGESQELRAKVKEAFGESRKHVASLTVQTDVAGAEISVDGKVLGRTPLGTVYVAPGRHVVKATDSEGRTQQRAFATDGGASEEFRLNLVQSGLEPSAQSEPKSSPSPTKTETTPAVARDAGGWHRGYTTIAVGSVLTIGAAVGSFVFSSEAGSKDREAQKIRADLGSATACDDAANSSSCSDLQDTLSSRNSANVMSGVFLGSAIGLGVATVVVTYLVWPERPSTQVQISFVPFADPSGGGFHLSGSF